jgi:hypothetical protein
MQLLGLPYILFPLQRINTPFQKHTEAILEKASQHLADQKAELRILRIQLAKENAPSNQKTEEKTELPKGVIPPQPADLPSNFTKPTPSERTPIRIAPNKISNPNQVNPSTQSTVDEHGDFLGHEEAATGQMDNFQKTENKKIREVRSEVVTNNPGKPMITKEDSSIYVVP